ncbi:sugar MFS transporter [Stenotrophomonas maltophilia]|nr:glucose/galactose MFS transporter [Stenotrophomonas maltophilia]MBA0249478.1 glucose/galactose MFS transporter [Stenotrophomonas maltophilia]MBA0306620.1 glucose/galactose MFS transporter [Stenotrophomonas maltophilia]MBA0438481.1 glucose/galactose MFS transporter [Stenotrophomonas maltophilia]MBA0516030.1 glucose/galactose MFS transporter [Stenotrophomonas maltophilia]
MQGSTRALMVVTAIFFMWGFLTCLNDILIPHLKASFALSWVQAMLIQFTFFGAYFLMSLPAGRLVAAVGYKRGIVAGLAIAGVGALLFWPAAAAHVYGLFLAALFVLATGITVLQVAANPYVALLGDERTSSSRLTLAQSMNSLGTTLAPLFGGLLILSAQPRSEAQLALLSPAEALAYRAAEAHSVQLPYFGLAVVLFLLAAAIWMFRLPAIAGVEGRGSAQGSVWEALRHRHVRLGVLAIFFYVGAEVSIGSVLVNFLSSPGIGHGMTEQDATGYVSLYWGGALVGRLLGAALLARLDARHLLGGFALVVVVLLGITVTTRGGVATWAVVSIGLFNSIMFPTIFALAIARLGALTGQASSLLVMAIVGGAVIPLAMGWLADHHGLQLSFLLPVLCYAYIAFYAWKGSRLPAP